jgi:transposase
MQNGGCSRRTCRSLVRRDGRTSGRCMRYRRHLLCHAGGLAWRLLPSDLPPWGTIYRWFAARRDDGRFERINHALVMADRERVGRDASPRRQSSTARASRPLRPVGRAATMLERRSTGVMPRGGRKTGSKNQTNREGALQKVHFKIPFLANLPTLFITSTSLSVSEA